MIARFGIAAAFALGLADVSVARAQDAGPSAANTDDAQPPPTATDPVLERTPDEWPRAADGKWAEWTPETRPTDDVLARMRAAAVAYSRGDLPASLAQLYALLDEAPDYPPALYQAGAIYFRLRRYGDSAYAMRRYLDVAPARVEDTRALGHALYTLGEYAEAAAHYRRVIDAGGEHPEALRGLALSLWREGDPDAALALLDRVLEVDPEHPEAELWRARVLYDEELVEEALVAAEAARERDPWEPQAWFLLARLRYELGQDEAAEEAQARFLVLDRVEQEARVLESQLLYAPHQPDLRSRLVELRASTEDLPAVREALAEWMHLRPDDRVLRIYALDVLQRMGDREGADLAAESLCRVAEDDLDSWVRLARYYATTRQRAKQVEAERRAAALR